MNIDSTESPARGYIKFNNKTYTIHEGQNVVGRNPEASVIICNLSASKLHAIITVLDESTHFISDFRSANGTWLDNQKLVPFKLYKLKNGASIRFGDTFSTYSFLTGNATVQNINTQSFDDNVFKSCTQRIQEKESFPGIDINELPTQVFCEKVVPFDELPTQVFQHSDSSNDSIDFATMEKAKSQHFNINSPVTSTPVVKSQTGAEILSQIKPVGKRMTNVIESDSDTSGAEPLSQIKPVQKTNKRVVASDSSDTEEYDVKTIDKYHISDDSETDAEEENKDQKSPAENSGRDLRFETTEGLIVEQKDEEKPHEKTLPADHVYCQTALSTSPIERRNEEIDGNQNGDSGQLSTVTEESFANLPTEDAAAKSSDNAEEHFGALPDLEQNEENALKPSGIDQSLIDDADEFFDELPAQEPNKKNEPLEKNLSNKENSETPPIVDNIFTAMTQTNEETTNQKTSNQIEEFFDQPTQALQILDGPEPKELLKNEETLQTQELIDVLVDKPLPPSPFKSPRTIRKSKLSLKKIEEEDSFIIQPTQALEVMHEPEAHYHTVEDQLHGIFASQSILSTQQLFETLDQSVIEDSMQATKIEENIEDILADSFEKQMSSSTELLKEEQPSTSKVLKKDEVKNSRKENKNRDSSQNEEIKINDSNITLRRRGKKEESAIMAITESPQLKDVEEKKNEVKRARRGKALKIEESVEPNTVSKRGVKRINEEKESPKPETSRSTRSRRGRNQETESNENSVGDGESSKEKIAKNIEIEGKNTRRTRTTSKNPEGKDESKEDHITGKQKGTNLKENLKPEENQPKTRGRTKRKDAKESEVDNSSPNKRTRLGMASPVRRLSANSKQEKKKKNQNGTLLESTPIRNRRVLKPKIIFTMLDDPKLESAIRALGGTVVDTMNECTVLVTVSIKRTEKLLCAVGQGKPICSPLWIQESKKANHFLDPFDYLVNDEEAENKWQFSLRESLHRASQEKLLCDFTFQLIVNTGGDVLKGAIESCGGKCVTRNLASSSSKHLVIVSTPNNKNKYKKIVAQNPNVIVVEAEAVFDGTLRQQFNFEKHKLI